MKSLFKSPKLGAYKRAIKKHQEDKEEEKNKKVDLTGLLEPESGEEGKVLKAQVPVDPLSTKVETKTEEEGSEKKKDK